MSSVIRRTIQRIGFPVLLWPVLMGQTPPTQKDAPVAAVDPLGRSTPRGTVFNFLRAAQEGNFGTAAQYLKIGNGPGSPQSDAARGLAAQLKAVLDRKLQIVPGAISDSPEATRADGFPAEREQVGSLSTGSSPVPIVLQRIQNADGSHLWLFASETLERIPRVHQSLAPSLIERNLPEIWVKTQFFGLAVWRWIALLLLLPTTIG